MVVVGVFSVGCAQKSFGSPSHGGGCIVNVNNQFFLPWISPTWTESIKQRDQVLVNEPRRIEGSSGWQHRHNMEPAGIPSNGQHAFSDRMVLFAITGV
jgi:hypothetical protein